MSEFNAETIGDWGREGGSGVRNRRDDGGDGFPAGSGYSETNGERDMDEGTGDRRTMSAVSVPECGDGVVHGISDGRGSRRGSGETRPCSTLGVTKREFSGSVLTAKSGPTSRLLCSSFVSSFSSGGLQVPQLSGRRS